MGAVLFVQNYANTIAFPAHTLDANEEASGNEVFRLADGRRSPFDFWGTTTVNQAAWARLDLGSSKAADMLAIDRGHNLGGLAGVKLQKSTDNFVANTVDVVTFTIPAAASADDTALSAGARTPEGAFLLSFASTSSRYWRLLIPAMGAGVKPKIVGWFVGPRYEPTAFTGPIPTEVATLRTDEEITSTGWRGRTTPVRVRGGSFQLELLSHADYLTAATHLRDHFDRGRPMWIIYDDTRAERAVLALRTQEEQGFGLTADWVAEAGTHQWVEHEPLVAA